MKCQNTVKIGDIVHTGSEGQMEYMVVRNQSDNTISLLNMNYSSIVSRKVIVDDWCNITKEEFEELVGIDSGFYTTSDGSSLYKTTYSYGDKFKLVGTVFNGDEYILAQVSKNLVALISLSSGNRWTDPVEVLDHNNITESEFELISSGTGRGQFIFFSDSEE